MREAGDQMSRETSFRLFANNTVKMAIIPEIQSCARRIETLAEEIMSGKNPEVNNHDRQRLEEILDACMGIKCYSEKL